VAACLACLGIRSPNLTSPDTTMEKPASTWSFDQGTLTIHYLGKTVSLGRYATHELAAKAAAVYFAKRRARKKHSALRPASSAAGMLSKNECAPTANISREQIPPQVKRHR
jgi:hypothetical protein